MSVYIICMFWKICEQISKIIIRFQIICFRRLCYAVNNYRTICTIDSINHYNGVKASAILYSLVETAKANMINTFEYFNLLFAEIPQHMDDKISDLWMIFFHCHPECRKHVSAGIKSLNFFNVHIYFDKPCSIPVKMRGFLLSSTHI